ncbi:DUF7691 family protein [Nocardiopsis potens]|uniref:DUF7691 family protein n=1 Tax=Nocardiopsis potens TaxID=1246458 RepID=UPI00034B08F0|nr:hypothetical protein [Nocardiopsis potens]
MSYGLMPYAVDLAELRSVIGSGSEHSLNALLRSSWGRELDRLDDLFDGQDGPSAREAARHLLLGEEYHQRSGALYAYCLKALLEAHDCASFLPNGEWYPVRYDWFDEVRGELKDGGVSFDPASLTYRGQVVPLPSVDDFPQIGCIEADRAAELAAEFDAMNEDRIDPQALDGVREMHGWFRECARTGRGLVTYYH